MPQLEAQPTAMKKPIFAATKEMVQAAGQKEQLFLFTRDISSLGCPLDT